MPRKVHGKSSGPSTRATAAASLSATGTSVPPSSAHNHRASGWFGCTCQRVAAPSMSTASMLNQPLLLRGSKYG